MKIVIKSLSQRELLEDAIKMCDTQERCITMFYLVNSCYQHGGVTSEEFHELTGILSERWVVAIKPDLHEKRGAA